MQIMKQRYVFTLVTGTHGVGSHKKYKCCIRLVVKTRFDCVSLSAGIRCLECRCTVWLADFDSQNVVMVYGGKSTQAVFTRVPHGSHVQLYKRYCSL